MKHHTKENGGRSERSPRGPRVSPGWGLMTGPGQYTVLLTPVNCSHIGVSFLSWCTQLTQRKFLHLLQWGFYGSTGHLGDYFLSVTLTQHRPRRRGDVRDFDPRTPFVNVYSFDSVSRQRTEQGRVTGSDLNLGPGRLRFRYLESRGGRTEASEASDRNCP